MTYFIAGFHKHTELDDYQNGCNPDTSAISLDDTRLWSDTHKNLLAEVLEHFEVEPDAVTLNACGENGRIDVCRWEDERGDKITLKQVLRWRSGKLKIYHATYTGHLEVKSDGIRWRRLKGCAYE